MTTRHHTDAPWDAEGLTTFYAAPDESDAITMIEIRANVTEAGWDTVAFVEAIWPNARANARLIRAAPALLNAAEFTLPLLEVLACSSENRQERKAFYKMRRAINKATKR